MDNSHTSGRSGSMGNPASRDNGDRDSDPGAGPRDLIIAMESKGRIDFVYVQTIPIEPEEKPRS